MGTTNDFKILLVEDDTACRQLVSTMLTGVGFTKTTATASGSEALEKLATPNVHFDCVIADIHMERGNGLQLLQAIRLGLVRALRPDMCFVLMTAFPDPDVIATAKKLDVNGFVLKPFSPEKLRDEIASARSRVYPIDRVKYQSVVLN